MLGEGHPVQLSRNRKSFFVEVSLKLFDHNLIFFTSFFQLPLLLYELRQFVLQALSCVRYYRAILAFGVTPLILL